MDIFMLRYIFSGHILIIRFGDEQLLFLLFAMLPVFIFYLLLSDCMWINSQIVVASVFFLRFLRIYRMFRSSTKIWMHVLPVLMWIKWILVYMEKEINEMLNRTVVFTRTLFLWANSRYFAHWPLHIHTHKHIANTNETEKKYPHFQSPNERDQRHSSIL